MPAKHTANHHGKPIARSPCDGCLSRPHCVRTGDSCPQYRIRANIGRIRATKSRIPDGLKVTDPRALATDELVI